MSHGDGASHPYPVRAALCFLLSVCHGMLTTMHISYDALYIYV